MWGWARVGSTTTRAIDHKIENRERMSIFRQRQERKREKERELKIFKWKRNAIGTKTETKRCHYKADSKE